MSADLSELEEACRTTYAAWAAGKSASTYQPYAEARRALTEARFASSQWPDGAWVVAVSEWDGEQAVEVNVGPFASEDEAERWADSNGLQPFSCWDLYEPIDFLLDRQRRAAS